MKGRSYFFLGTLLVLVTVGASCERPLEPEEPGQRSLEESDGPRRGGVLRLASSDDVPTLDPAIGYDSLSWFFEQLIFDTLLDYDDEGHLIPRLAASWEVSSDHKTYTFRLKPGLKFSDGSPLTAGDFVFSLQRVIDPATASQGAEFFRGIAGARDFAQGRASRVLGLAAPDSQTVVIRLELPDPLFPHKLTLLFSAVVPRRLLEKPQRDFASHPVGSGPFMLEQWRRGDRIKLERNPYYRNPDAVYLDGVEQLVGVSEQLAWLKFESGELDVAAIPPAEFPRVVADPEYRDRLVKGVTLTTSYIGINCQMAPFDRVDVRRAVNYAVDKAGIIKLISGRGVEAKGVLPPGMPGYDSSLAGYPYDPAKAKKLLAEAGLSHGFATTLWTQNRETDLRVAQKVQQDLAAVGISVEIKTVAWASFLEAIREPGRVPLFDLGWFADFPDPSNFLEVLFHGRNFAANNHTFYNNPEVNELLDIARDTYDVAKRLEILGEVERLVVADAPWVFLYHPITYAAVQRGVHNYRIHPLRPPRLEKVWLER